MHLSETRRKALYLLTVNGHYHSKDLAKSLKVSQETAYYHLNAIQEEQLGKFVTFCDWRMIGYTFAYYFISLNDPTKNTAQQLKEHEDVNYLVTCFGTYDLKLIIGAYSNSELQEKLQRINQTVGENMRDFTLFHLGRELKWTDTLPSIRSDVEHPHNQKDTFHKLTAEEFSFPDEYESIELDELDRHIIYEYLKDPRSNYSEVARTTDCSRETVRYRVQKLISKGFIRHISFVLNHKKFGYFTNGLLLKVHGEDKKAFFAFLKQREFIYYAMEIRGSYNYLIYLVSKSPEEFSRHTKQLRSFLKDHLRDIQFFYYEEELKNEQYPKELFEDIDIKTQAK